MITRLLYRLDIRSEKKLSEFSSVGIITAVALVLSACSGGDNSQPTQSAQTETLSPLPPLPLSAPNSFTNNRKNIGIGPAFLRESPLTEYLSTKTEYDDTLMVHSGQWRGTNDGSTGAGNIINYIKSFKPEDGVGFVIPNYGTEQKTLRLSSDASKEEKQAVEHALRLINAALPWDKRIKLGTDFDTFDRGNVPNGEIHIHFTEGKTDWPSDVDENGLGKAKIDMDNVVLSGYALIDTEGIEEDEVDLQEIITRELLRAYGIVVHGEADKFPDSTRLLASNRPVYLSLDGETLLAITTLAPGTDVDKLTPTNLGSWEEIAFHLLGVLDLNSDQKIEFGAGFRNGLGKPWAFGPVPETTLAENEDLTDTSAKWSGYLLGFTADGYTVTGLAEIEIDFKPSKPSGTAEFTDLETWGMSASTSPGAKEGGTPWTGGITNTDELSYSIEIVREGDYEGFVSVSTRDETDDKGIVSGAFVGTAHEGTIGTVEHPDLSAGFGATRETETSQ